MLREYATDTQFDSTSSSKRLGQNLEKGEHRQRISVLHCVKFNDLQSTPKKPQPKTSETILNDFMDARFRHNEAREQMRALLNTFIRPKNPKPAWHI